MTCTQRPASIRCADCKAERKLNPKSHQPVPTHCKRCARRLADRKYNEKLKAAPDSIRGRSPTEALGPDRPEGLTEREARRARDARVVRLYQTEPELCVAALAERFGVEKKVIYKALEDAQVALRADTDSLPAGMPL